MYKPRVVLLDMDGVVTKAPHLSTAIRNRVCSYVSNRLKIPYTRAEKVNEVLYKSFGHTLIGLQKLYDPSITLQDFCSYVYDDKFVEILEPVQSEINEMEEFIEHAKQNQTKVYIFTNAPSNWCNHILQTDRYQVIGCDHPIYSYSMSPEVNLKPSFSTYIKVMKYLKAEDYIFVDDSIPNLIPMMHHKDWKLVWMNNGSGENLYTPQLHTINKLEQLFIYL